MHKQYSILLVIVMSVLTGVSIALSSSRLVIVSGGNRGVGIGICRQVLATDPNCEVLVTARNLEQAESVRDSLNKIYNGKERAHAFQLDVTSEESCQALQDALTNDSFGEGSNGDRPITLVNNAGVAYDLPWFPTPWPVEAASKTLDVNLFGAERLTRMLLPHLLSRSKDGRVIFVSSGGGRANMKRMSEGNRQNLLREDITWDDIQKLSNTFVSEYEEAAKVGLMSEDDKKQLPYLSSSGLWLQSYGFSKACLGAYTQIIARQYPEIISLACSPGFIATDMSRTYAKYDELLSVDDGGKFVAWLATSDKEALESGVFYTPDKKVVSFVAD